MLRQNSQGPLEVGDAVALGRAAERAAHDAGHADGAVAVREEIYGEGCLAFFGEAFRYVPDGVVEAGDLVDDHDAREGTSGYRALQPPPSVG